MYYGLSLSIMCLYIIVYFIINMEAGGLQATDEEASTYSSILLVATVVSVILCDYVVYFMISTAMLTTVRSTVLLMATCRFILVRSALIIRAKQW